MEPSRIHELNKIVGVFCGKELNETDVNSMPAWFYTNERGHLIPWHPCIKHAQAAEVKEKLREKGYGYALGWDQERKKYMALIQAGETHKSPIVECGSDESELITLLLVVEAVMKKEKHA